MVIAGIPILVRRKPIRHIYLRVHGQDVTLSAPARISDATIRAFVNSRLDWIKRQLEQALPPVPFPPRIQRVWGEPKIVRIASAPVPEASIAGAALIVAAPAPICEAVWERALGALFRNLVLAAAPAVIEAWRARLGLAPVSLGARRMKSRWGTCYPARRRIILNSALAAKPPACLEEVIAHELMHFFEPNHGPAFKKLMDAHLPDWRETATLLNQPDRE